MIEVKKRSDQPSSNWNAADDYQSYVQDGLRWRLNSRPRIWRPAADVYEVEDAIIVRVEIAGMREPDFVVSLHARLLTISGTRSDVPERRAYHQIEIPFGEFSLDFELPDAVDENRVEAHYKDGFLKVFLPKARSHTIKIEE